MTDRLLALAVASEPLAGLDFVLISSDHAAKPTLPPIVEMELGAFRDAGWSIDLTESGETTDATAHLAQAIVLQTGSRWTGPTPSDVFAPIPRDWLLDACARELVWWQERREIGGHPIRVRTAVLNACRARRYALEGTLCSKPQGGRWALGRGDTPQRDAILSALALQAGNTAPIPTEEAIRELVEQAVDAISTART